MNRCYFVRADHKNYYILFSLIYIIVCCVPAVIIVEKKQYIFEMILLILVMLVATIMLAKHFYSRGLYMNNEKTTYKSFCKKEIALDDVKGIKIIKSAIMTKYITIHLRDKNNNNLYTCIFLKEVERQMDNITHADYYFIREYKKSILFHTVFDIELINYILKRNTNIEILCDNKSIKDLINA